MGWNLRRSKKVGPFRINLSKSGLGISAGVKGLRFGRDAKGRNYSAISIPGTGLYKRKYFSSNTKKASVSKAYVPKAKSSSTPGQQLRGLIFLVSIGLLIFGHWIFGGILLLTLIAGFVRQSRSNLNTSQISEHGGDLKNAGNIPQETLDYLAEKHGNHHL